MSFAEASAVLAALAAVLLVGWVTGAMALRWAASDASGTAGAGFGAPERALAAVGGFVFFSVALMVAHIVSGGLVFGLPGVVVLAGVGIVLLGLRNTRPGPVRWRAPVAAALVLGVLYATPAIIGGSSLRSGDTPWHMGRTSHLLGGRLVPGGPAAAFDRNAYPWGFHAVLATTVRLVPGSSPATALTTTCFLLLLALPLAAACLARLVDPRAGWPAAACFALIGGVGWLDAGHPVFFTSPGEARFGADLVTASPNGLYALFPPALPRELGLALLVLAALLAAAAARRGDRRSALLAGGALGLVGLVSVPMIVNGAVWAVIAVATVRDGNRVRILGWIVVASASVFALWAVPVAVNYVRLGGFVNVAPILGREWSLSTALASWGLLLPLAVGGLVVAATRGGGAGRPLIALAAASALMYGFAVARGAFDWSLGGVPWLLHQGRMWPPAHMVAAALGGVLVAWVLARATGRSRRAVALLTVALFCLGVVSPVFASIALTDLIRDHRGGFIYAGQDFAAHGFVRRAAARLGPEDVVRTSGSPNLDLYLFQYSGVRVANFDDENLERNDARIRFAELARRWDDTIATGGFPADYAAVPAARRPPGKAVVARGRYEGRTFVLVRL